MFQRWIFLLSLLLTSRAQSTNDGVILLHSSQAIVHGDTLRYEPQTNKITLGYWTKPTDWGEWKFTVSKPGAYDIEVLQGCGKGNGGSDVKVEVAGQTIDFVVFETGHFQNFLPRNLGRVHFWKAGDYSLALKPQNKKAAAVMDVRQVRLLPAPNTPESEIDNAILNARRVVFLGDSITYSGEYIEFFEAYLRRRYSSAEFDFINLGLPSETVSSLSEPGHAGGAFPRPDLHERLGRILTETKPDLIFACYGMNDGIYYPFAEERFAKFRDGMTKLREKAAAAGAKVIHITSPTFDPRPLKGKTLPAGLAEYRQPFERYNEVLDTYSQWLVSKHADGWEVIDIHTQMNAALQSRGPDFRFANDGVHPGADGHWLIAQILGENFTDSKNAWLERSQRNPELLDLVQKHQRLRKDAWLTKIGHKRPGMNKGKPFDEAEAEADKLALKIAALQDPQLPGKRIRWKDYEIASFDLDNKPVRIAQPKDGSGLFRPWIAFEKLENAYDTEQNLLAAGFYLVETDNRSATLEDLLVKRYGFETSDSSRAARTAFEKAKSNGKKE